MLTGAVKGCGFLHPGYSGKMSGMRMICEAMKCVKMCECARMSSETVKSVKMSSTRMSCRLLIDMRVG